MFALRGAFYLKKKSGLTGWIIQYISTLQGIYHNWIFQWHIIGRAWLDTQAQKSKEVVSEYGSMW